MLCNLLIIIDYMYVCWFVSNTFIAVTVSLYVIVSAFSVTIKKITILCFVKKNYIHICCVIISHIRDGVGVEVNVWNNESLLTS